MARVVTLPFLTSDGARVRMAGWSLSTGDATIEGHEDGCSLPHWEYGVDLDVKVRFAIDLDALRADCGLPPGAEVGLSLAWMSSRTALRGATPAVPVESAGEREIALALSGAELGGMLSLQGLVVLTRPAPTDDALVASRVGSRLWTQPAPLQVALEGSGPRFPTAPVSFASAGLGVPEGAAWYLEMGSDLESSFLGSSCLYLNTDNERVAELLRNPESPQGSVLMTVLKADLAGQLMARASVEEDLDPEGEYPPESLGSVLQGALRATGFPGGAAGARTQFRAAPEFAYAWIKASAGFLV